MVSTAESSNSNAHVACDVHAEVIATDIHQTNPIHDQVKKEKRKSKRVKLNKTRDRFPVALDSGPRAIFDESSGKCNEKRRREGKDYV